MDTTSSKQIDLEEIFKKIRVDNISSFELYLKEIWIVHNYSFSLYSN